MNVLYDKKNDVVSVYFDYEEYNSSRYDEGISQNLSERSYDTEEAANLILDMVDLTDGSGNLVGFRVFNASKHYDINLLNSADPEELSIDELNRKVDEKVLGVFGR